MPMRSLIVSASSWSWVTKMVVMPISRWMRFSSICMSTRSALSSAPSGSSSNSTRGLVTMARASATRWRWPPDSWCGRRPPSLPELHEVERTLHFGGNHGLGLAAHRQAEGDIVGDAHIGKQRIVLEHHADAPLFDRHPLDALAADGDAAGVRKVETGDLAQQRGLAAARWPEQRIEAAIGEIDGDVVQRLVRAKAARDVRYLHAGHYFSPPNLKKRAVSSMSAIDTTMMMVETALISGVKPLRIAA